MVNQWADGKSNPMKAMSIWLGFGIYLNKVELAAVQTMPVKSGSSKYAIWIHPELTNDQQLKLAASCLALIITTEQNLLTQ